MIVVDSNIWIFAEVKDAPEHRAALQTLKRLLPRKDVGVNVIITSEVFHKISVFFGAVIARERLQPILLHPSVQWLEFSHQIAERAIEVADEEGLRINDALIAAQAMELKAKVLTDNVKDFRRIRGLKLVPFR